MKRVLITGCSSGMGRMLVRSFLNEGWLVTATLRRAEERQDLFSDDLSSFPDQLTLETLDMVSPEDRARMAALLQDGGLDCLINNAGFALFGALENCTETQIRNQMDVNLLAPILLTRALLPALRKNQGQVINISSMMGFVGFPLSSVYCSSKAGLGMWSEALKHELTPHGVSVHVVEPGGFRTQFGKNVQWAQHDVGAYRTWTDGYRALNRRLSEGEGKAPTPVIARIMELARGERLTLRHRIGKDSIISAILNWLVPEPIRLVVLGRMFKGLFARSST